MFSGWTVRAYSKETQLGSSDQEAFPSAGKNTGVVLVPYCYLCFRLALPDSVSYFFFLYRSPSLPLCMVFDSISCNVDEVLIHCGGTDRPGDRSISNDLIQMLNFSTWIPDYDSHSPALLICFFLLTLAFFFLQWLFLHWEILIMLLSQSPLTFHQIHNRMPCFIA